MDRNKHKGENKELMAERLRLYAVDRCLVHVPFNTEPSYGGTSADPNAANAIETDYTFPDNRGQSDQSSQAPTSGDDMDTSENSLRSAHISGQSEKSSDSEDNPDNIKENDTFYSELNEANNISKAAYKELMTMAVEAKTWVVATPALGSLEEFLQMFRSPPLPGKRVERSIQSASVPIDPDLLVAIMMNADSWASSFSHLVSHESVHDPPDVLLKLAEHDDAIKSILLVDAKFQLPTPLVQSRKFCLFRCLRKILPDAWAIVDISRDYFPGAAVSGMENIWRKRPSGLLVRRNGKYSEVIWIENVEIPEVQSKDGIYSGLIDSNLAFSAKRWVDALIWKIKRHYSRFSEVNIKANQRAGAHLLNLAETMREVYLDIVSETPDEEKWVTLSNKDVRILRSSTDSADSGMKNYIAVTSFQLQKRPISLIDILEEKNRDIQWPTFLNMDEPEEVIRFSSESNCITLHKNAVFLDDATQDLEYLLQETSRDGFCFFVTSTPISRLDVDIALVVGSSGHVKVQPSGFAVMPDDFHSDASLVTVAIQKQLNVPASDQAILIMCDLVNGLVRQISEEVSRLSNTSS